MNGEVNNFKDAMNFVEIEIYNAMVKVTKEYENLEKGSRTNTWITETIKKNIGEIGINKGYKISSSIHNSEWLYDLIWYENNENGLLQKLTLALESELSDRNPSGLHYDFDKILVANSDYRVFVCFNEGNYNFPSNINNLIALFEESVSAYNNLAKNSRILILIWDDFTTGEIYPHLILT